MMSLAFGLFTQVSGSGPLGPLVCFMFGADSSARQLIHMKNQASFSSKD